MKIKRFLEDNSTVQLAYRPLFACRLAGGHDNGPLCSRGLVRNDLGPGDGDGGY